MCVMCTSPACPLFRLVGRSIDRCVRFGSDPPAHPISSTCTNPTHPPHNNKQEGEPPKFDPRDPRTVEKDSERWFAMQAEREANGELNLFENPAFYSVLFFAVPILILVWGFGSGVIPGLVPVEPDYSLVEEQSLKSVSYSDLTGAAAGAAQRGGSLF